RACGVAHVLPDLFQKRPSPHASRLLPDLQLVAECAFRGISCVRSSRIALRLRFELEVVAQLAFEVAVAIHHSYLNATSGSTRDARRAGTYPAAAATIASTRAASPIVIASCGVTP